MFNVDSMKKINRPMQVLTLALITTFIAELFFGTTPISRAYLLVPQLLYYGSAAILIREISRRYKFPWISIVFLGLAFGCIEEGLTLQSFFSPKFIGVDLSYGRIGGINTQWALFITGYHCFWTICTSLLLTELIFKETAAEPWLGKTGMWFFGIFFLAICVALNTQMRKMSGFNSPVYFYLGTFCVVIILILIAIKQVKGQYPHKRNQSNSGFWVVTLSAFLLGFGWQFGLFMHFIIANAPPVLDFCFAAVLLTAGILLIRYWAASIHWGGTQKCGLVMGLVSAELVTGYFVTRHNPIDRIGHPVIIICALAFLYLLKLKLEKNTIDIVPELTKFQPIL